MKWLITGGAGFIGSHLCELLLARGDSVVVVDDHSTGRPENLQLAASAVERRRLVLHKADVRDLSDVVDVDEMDHIVHLAAVVGVQKVLAEPTRMLTVNLEGAASVLAAAKQHRKPVFVASTSEVYGRNDSPPFGEDAGVVLGPSHVSRWGYAVSKLADEFLALAYHKQYGVPVRVARLFNTVGPRQTGQYGMVVPRFVGAALAGRPLVVYGDGEQTRCFCHVHDTVRAIVDLCLCEAASGQVVNVGSNAEEVSIRALAERTIAWTRSASAIEYKRYEDLGADFEDMRRRVPDVRKIASLTGWRAQKSLQDIVMDVAESCLRGGA